MNYLPRNIVAEKSVLNTEYAKHIISNLPNAEIIEIDEYLPSCNDPRNTLFLSKNKSSWLKPCPATPLNICCGYYILNFAAGCPINCSYCILNGYFESRSISIYCDVDRIEAELNTLLSNGKIYRIGSGEFTDSLAFDHISNFSKFIIPIVLKHKNITFEFKTKSNNIKNLLEFKGDRRIMVSWSLNPETIIKNEEMGSASLTERLEAASKCAKNGYRVGFHFDPIIYHENWEDNYSQVVDRIYKYVNPEDIGWISMGGFRFPPNLKDKIESIYPKTEIMLEEFVLGKDGKMRYFRPLRRKIYKVMKAAFEKLHKNPPLYMCMETPRMWEDVFDKKKFSCEGLCDILDKKV